MMGIVNALWRFPVKSMQGENLESVEVTARGVLGDRAYGLLDVETGAVASAKRVRQFPNLMRCRAAFVEAPQAGCAAPAVRIELPDGQTVHSDDGDRDAVLSAYFQRQVRLVRAAPGMAIADDYTGGPDDVSAPSAVTVGPGAAMGAFRDAYPTSILTTSTLERFNELQPGSRFDARRFRMNIIIKTEQAGFIENNWLDQELQVGAEVRLNVAARDARCVMTTLPQDDLPEDREILRSITRHNKVRAGGVRKRPCAGVYAAVIVPGVVRTGDGASLA